MRRRSRPVHTPFPLARRSRSLGDRLGSTCVWLAVFAALAWIAQSRSPLHLIFPENAFTRNAAVLNGNEKFPPNIQHKLDVSWQSFATGKDVAAYKHSAQQIESKQDILNLNGSKAGQIGGGVGSKQRQSPPRSFKSKTELLRKEYKGKMDRPVKSSKETHNAVNGKSPVKMPNKQQLKEMMMLEAGRMKLARICDDAEQNADKAQQQRCRMMKMYGDDAAKMLAESPKEAFTRQQEVKDAIARGQQRAIELMERRKAALGIMDPPPLPVYLNIAGNSSEVGNHSQLDTKYAMNDIDEANDDVSDEVDVDEGAEDNSDVEEQEDQGEAQ
mmetsp:Transcript_7517/g.14208  ORF Transcript_7517/g.14208 Transcript_7517/m.14208 type:complete len:329 (+) Transcript_7517:115-1101(+)|eukprot:CAMPEP_0114245890 /NCGR_PEP_ID=MMETSP0058-20121206/12154_1 /TAXON_ID=36894 /ORGANISM="Pyramimonas parkeae, CCMP726" /LENGTH=328 /DNA_ID=CAMNT_0001359007 /DNA_START=69 /DNA_END=1055 /DNA_ORIENTATION=+